MCSLAETQDMGRGWLRIIMCSLAKTQDMGGGWLRIIMCSLAETQDMGGPNKGRNIYNLNKYKNEKI